MLMFAYYATLLFHNVLILQNVIVNMIDYVNFMIGYYELLMCHRFCYYDELILCILFYYEILYCATLALS